MPTPKEENDLAEALGILRQIRRTLVARKMTANYLAELLGWNKTKISKLNTGRKLTLKEGMLICRQLNITPDFLLSDSEEVPNDTTPEQKVVLDMVFGETGIGFTEAMRRMWVGGKSDPSDPKNQVPRPWERQSGVLKRGTRKPGKN